MEKITYHCEIITPMFIGNAIPGQAELRPPAIKAALRFWWRAMNAGMPISNLREEEAKIFGSSDENHGRSKLIITVAYNIKPTQAKFPAETIRRKIQKTQKPSMAPKDINILEYLAFGAVDRGDYKEYFAPGEGFQINISYPNGFNITPIENALFLCSIFGGLGSKARNGFGRFSISQLPGIKTNDLLKQLKINSKSSFTSFSNDISLYTLNSNKPGWNKILAELGKSYISSRVNYHNGSTLLSSGLEDEHNYQLRPFIASPLLEGKNTHLPKYGSTTVSKLQRHSKTYFFGIEKNKNGYVGYMLHLPYKYLSGSGSELLLTTPNITLLQINYDTASNAFNTNLVKNGLTKVTL